MRKDVYLGMTIGGIMLAVVIIYLTVSTTSKHDRHGVEVGAAIADAGSGGSGDAPGQTGDAPAGEYKPSVSSGSHAPDASARNKPTILSATTVEKSDPVWGPKLWANSVVSVTPDPNGAPDPQTAVSPAPDVAPERATVEKVTGDVPGGARTVLVPPATPDSPSREKADEPAAPHGTSAIPASKSHIHKVQKGETLSTIAAAAYGSPHLYPYILRANPKIDPNRLKLGAEIVLPDASEVKGPEKSDEKSAEKSTDAGTSAHKVEPTTVDARTEYRIQSGDSLHKISMKLYGKIDMVQKIYDLNKAAIGDNPAKLKLGTILKLPAAPTVN